MEEEVVVALAKDEEVEEVAVEEVKTQNGVMRVCLIIGHKVILNDSKIKITEVEVEMEMAMVVVIIVDVEVIVEVEEVVVIKEYIF
jgi:hypothetical protein